MGRFVRVLAIACAVVAGAGAARAAELRITLAELAGLVDIIMDGGTLHLHNKPGGVFSGATGSHLTIAGMQTAIPLAPKSFKIFGSTYAYYVENLNSESIAVEPVQSAIRLTLKFATKESYLVGGCVAGDCALAEALPRIVWKNGTVAIDVAPVHFGTSITLQVRNIIIGGALSARCGGGGGVFSDSACKLALPWANRTIAKLKPDIAAQVKDKVNSPATQSAVADGLKKYLVVGQAGEIAITDVASDTAKVIIKFQLATAAGG